MLDYVVRRTLLLIPLLFVISIISFIIIELPPGDWVTTYVQTLRMSGVEIAEEEVSRLTRVYGLDKTLYMRYFIWLGKVLLQGDFGWSFQWNRPVAAILAERVPLTMLISFLSIVVSWLIAVPIGIYSAVRQYSFWDYFFTFIGFIGLSVPGFLLALIVAWTSYRVFGVSILGLFSSEFIEAPWGVAKFLDMMKRIWIPLLIVGMGGTAGIIRVMRANLLDELRKQYVVTARAKGLAEKTLLFKYPVRVAINPLVSTVGWVLPAVVSGEALVAIVLSLDTTGPLLLRAVMSQDMYLAGSIVMILSTLTVIGTLISDVLLAWLDPRIRYEAPER